MRPEVDSARKLPLLAGLEDEQIDRILTGSVLERYPTGKLLFEEGELPDYLHACLSGTVELFTSHTSGNCGLMLMSPGDVFMPAAVLFQEPYLVSARALTPSRILLLDAQAVRQEIDRSPALLKRFTSILAGQWRMAVRHVVDLKCRNAGQRLAAFLLRIVDDSGTPGLADLPVSKRHLASRVGMSAETLSRSLQTLADNGLTVRGNKVIVRDRASIDAFCGPSPYPQSDEIELGVHAL